MSYTERNFKTKKAVKEAVTAYLTLSPVDGQRMGRAVRCYNPGMGGDLSNHTGRVYLEGPHFPEPHKWYAQGEMENGILVKVK